ATISGSMSDSSLPVLMFVRPFNTYCIVFFFFFFQAEDGIRDRNVTGVQTCALPILALPGVSLILPEYQTPQISFVLRLFFSFLQIGRASCRERVFFSVVAGSGEKKRIIMGRKRTDRSEMRYAIDMKDDGPASRREKI